MGSLGCVESCAHAARTRAQALVRAPAVPAHAHEPIESSDDEDELPTRDAVAWAVDQLPDAEVAHVRAALANAPWLGKPLGKPWPVRWRGSGHRRGGPVGPIKPLSAFNLFGGPPKIQV